VGVDHPPGQAEYGVGSAAWTGPALALGDRRRGAFHAAAAPHKPQGLDVQIKPS